MKKDNLATSLPQDAACAEKISGHDHIHAANCGHKSFVHDGHICYLHDNHYHYNHNGHSHACSGPKATTAKVVSMSDARAKKSGKK